MTDIAVRNALVTPLLAAAKETGLRAPTSVYASPVGTTTTLTYTPDLSASEQTTFDGLARLALGTTLITPAEYETIRPQLVIVRDLRQLGRNAFMALADAEKFRRLYDAQAATTTIVLALLRE